jgi:hypothetical protein
MVVVAVGLGTRVLVGEAVGMRVAVEVGVFVGGGAVEVRVALGDCV